jgi:hypothetical protein
LKERSKTFRIMKERKKHSISPLHSLQQRKVLQVKPVETNLSTEKIMPKAATTKGTTNADKEMS